MSNLAEAYAPFQEALVAYEQIYPTRSPIDGDYEESHELLWVSGYVQHWMGENAIQEFIVDSGMMDEEKVYDPSVARDTAIAYANRATEHDLSLPIANTSISMVRTLAAVRMSRYLWRDKLPQFDLTQLPDSAHSKRATIYGVSQTVRSLLNEPGSHLRHVDRNVAFAAVYNGKQARKAMLECGEYLEGEFSNLILETAEADRG